MSVMNYQIVAEQYFKFFFSCHYHLAVTNNNYQFNFCCIMENFGFKIINLRSSACVLTRPSDAKHTRDDVNASIKKN